MSLYAIRAKRKADWDKDFQGLSKKVLRTPFLHSSYSKYPPLPSHPSSQLGAWLTAEGNTAFGAWVCYGIDGQDRAARALVEIEAQLDMRCEVVEQPDDLE